MKLFKNLLIRLLISDGSKMKIFSGPSSGSYVNYNFSNRTQHLLGLYEREIYSFLLKSYKKASLLVNIGANDGYYVLGMLQTGKKVIACEPGDRNDLIFNAKLNGFEVNKDYKLETRLVGNVNDVNYVSIKELIGFTDQTIFILVDIDGGEFDLLKSCGYDFNFKNVIWLIETHSKDLEEQCISFLKTNNYSITIIKPAWWRYFIPELRPLDHNRWFFATPNI